MARPTKDQQHAKLHRDALDQFDRIQLACRDVRKQCLEDRRFATIPGAQWEGPLSDQFENKPRLEVNKVALSVVRIFSEYRNNRITVDFISKDGDDRGDLAETCNGLYRADEQDSGAEEAYDNAFEEAVSGGIGAWRLRTCYEDDEDPEDERQRIRIEPIFDADSSVFFDVDAKRQDKADAKVCYVLHSMSPEAYKDEYGDDPSSWPKDISSVAYDWATPDVVIVAEYYRVEEKTETVRIFRTLGGDEERYTDSDFAADETLEDMLSATGAQEVRQKKIKRKKVRKYILSGGRILEDCGYIAGKHIPIVQVYGKRWFIDNQEQCMGQVRLAKDAQRLKNMQLSKLAETSALSGVEKPILTPEQIAGHQMMWSEDNIKNYPYLLVNPMVDPVTGGVVASGPIGYTKPPQIAPALAALLQLTEQDMAEILGSNQQADKMVSNISGKAVELIQQRLDMQSFLYMSNFAKAVKRGGEIWLSMAQEIYIEDRRKMKTVDPMDQVGSVELMQPGIDDDTGATVYKNDLTAAKFDVAVDVGPSFTSRRNATVTALTGMMQFADDPATRVVLQSMAIMNMDGEGLGDIKDYFRSKLVQMGVVKPTDEEAQQMAEAAQNQQPDAQTQFLLAEAEKSKQLSEKATADTQLSLAKAKETEANTIKTLSEVQGGFRQEFGRMPEAGPPAAQPGEFEGAL